MQFWIYAAVLLAISVTFVFLPMFRGRSQERNELTQEEMNLRLHGERLEDLRAAFAAGEMTKTAYEVQLAESHRLLLSESGAEGFDSSTAPERDHSRSALDQRFARATVVASSGLLLALCVVWYADFGASQGALAEWNLTQEIADFDQRPRTEAGMKALATAMAEVLEISPEHEQVAYYLAQLRLQLGEFEAAVLLLRSLSQRYPEDGDLLASLAEARYLAAGRVMAGDLNTLFDQALARAPANVTLLEILGMEAFKAGNLDEAKRKFSTALAHASGDRAAVIANVLANIAPGEPASSVPASPQEPSGSRRIKVRVEADPGLRVPPQAVLFVFARAVNGPPMPLAVSRTTAAALPLDVVLDSTMAMMPELSLTDFDEVEVVARVSASGSATATDGDYEARSQVISFSKPEVQLTLVLKP
jgi:cytochrome c-type biogenesis protein CcmH